MKSVIAVLLFGFVHSGSKLILQTGLSLLGLCLLYSGFRLFVQLPYIFNNKLYKIASKNELYLLAGMGAIGAALQFCEFKGIASGLSVGAVTFLIYSYPLWTLVLGIVINNEKITNEILVKIILSLIGSILIFQANLTLFKFSIHLLYPVVASFLMALWISLSNLAKKRKLNSWTISFYYDLFSFVSILIILVLNFSNHDVIELVNWLSQVSNFISISFYSIIFGVVPNILFYDASKNISAMKASLLLLFEPVISSIISIIIWNESIGLTFCYGATLILASNIQLKNLVQITLKKVGFYEKVHQ